MSDIENTTESTEKYTDSLFWTWFRMMVNLFGIFIAFLIIIFLVLRPGQLHGSINKVGDFFLKKPDF